MLAKGLIKLIKLQKHLNEALLLFSQVILVINKHQYHIFLILYFTIIKFVLMFD